MEDLPQAKHLQNLKIFNKKFVTGFTITEVIVSTLIIAMIAATGVGAFCGTKRSLNRARHRVQAYNFAVEALDRLRSNHQYSSVYLPSTTAMDPGPHTEAEIEATGILKGEIATLGGTLTYDVTEPEVEGYKQVTVRVHWDETETAF